MKTLLNFLLQEAKEEYETMSEEEFNSGKGIRPGPIRDDLKDLLKIKSAKDAKIVSSNDTSMAVNSPTEFLADLKMIKTNNFADLMTSIMKSHKDFKVFFSSVKIYKHPRLGLIASLNLSSTGKSVVSADSDLVRFYRFWIDSILYAGLDDGINKDKRHNKLSYKWKNTSIYVRYRKKV